MIELIIIAFGLGLVSNLHCLGMCGPIALALPLDRSSTINKVKGVSAYSVGRSLGYASLGTVIGIVGMSADLLGVLQWLSIGSGLLIILFAWRSHFTFVGKQSWLSSKVQEFMKAFLRRGDKKNTFSLGGFGLVNALLPCGMVYVALLSAMNFGGIANAMIFMFVFGLGTLPGFIVLALANVIKRPFFSKKIVVAILVSIVGLAMVVRGMNLGIPYISPKIELAASENRMENKKEKAMFSCCSKESETCD